MSNARGQWWPRMVLTGTTAIATLAAVAFTLTGGALRQPAQAAPVPSAQTNCPPPIDPRPVAATTAAYVAVAGIPGEATRSGVAGQISLTAVRFGLIASGSGLCGGGGGPASLDPVTVEKRVDKASVRLFAAAASGQHVTSARVTVWSETGAPRLIYSYDLADVTVAYVRQVQRVDSMTEEVAFNFRRITWSYTPVNPDGTPGTTITACWDRVNQTTC